MSSATAAVCSIEFPAAAIDRPQISSCTSPHSQLYIFVLTMNYVIPSHADILFLTWVRLVEIFGNLQQCIDAGTRVANPDASGRDVWMDLFSRLQNQSVYYRYACLSTDHSVMNNTLGIFENDGFGYSQLPPNRRRPQ